MLTDGSDHHHCGVPSLSHDDVRTADAYESARAESRRELATGQRHRRIPLGDTLTLIFENHATVRGVVEEALRSERIDDPEHVAREVGAFAQLVPGAGELCAMTVFEVADQAELSRRSAAMEGVTGSIRLVVGDAVIVPTDEHRSDDAGAGVGYLRFRLSADEQRRFADDAVDVTIDVDHPGYRASAVLTPEQREQLLADMAG